MKIKKIKIQNLKSISEKEMDLNGCSVIVTGGNGKGKTTLTRSFFDRILFEKNDSIIRRGEKNGFQTIELTNGNLIEWKLTDKSEQFNLTTKDGFKMTSLKQIKSYLFGDKKAFDINEFIEMSSKKQSECLQQLIGLDLSSIDSEYNSLYETRKDINKKIELFQFAIKEPTECENGNPESIKVKIDEVNKENEFLMQKFHEDLLNVSKWNESQKELEKQKQSIINKLSNLDLGELSQFFDFESAKKYIESHPDGKYMDIPTKPILLSTKDLEQALNIEIVKCTKYDTYLKDLETYEKEKLIIEELKVKKETIQSLMNELINEKKKKIQESTLPEGFEFCDEGIMYNGFRIDKTSQSTSDLYVAALKLATIVMGDLQTVHFEASALDKQSLDSVLEFAKSKDLQILVERPDYDGGDICYSIIESI